MDNDAGGKSALERGVRPLLPKLDAAGKNRVVPGWSKRALCAAAADALRTRLAAGSMLANVAFNWAQRPGYVLTAEDCEMLRTLQREWDAAQRVSGRKSDA